MIASFIFVAIGLVLSGFALGLMVGVTNERNARDRLINKGIIPGPEDK